MLGLFDYAEGFNLSLRVNFVDGGEESEGLTFTGSEGTMDIAGQTVSVNQVPREKDPGLFVNSFPEAMQKQIRASREEVSRSRIPMDRPKQVTKVCGARGIQRQLRPLQEFLRGLFAAVGR